MDWFFANLDGDAGAKKDKVNGAKSGETVSDIDV
jgi:hypothetical protein